MFKKISWLFVLVFFVSFTGVFFWYQMQEKSLQAHLYLGVQGGNTQVSLNHKSIGPAPIKDYLIPAGSYQLDLTTDRYTYSTTLRLSPQTATVVDWQIGPDINQSSGVFYELLPATDSQSQLTVVTLPDRALFTFDDQTTSNFTPFQIQDLSAGQHNIHLSLPGYQSKTVSFTLVPGYNLHLTVKLAQAN